MIKETQSCGCNSPALQQAPERDGSKPAHLARCVGEEEGEQSFLLFITNEPGGTLDVIKIQRVTQTFRNGHGAILTRSLAHPSVCDSSAVTWRWRILRVPYGRWRIYVTAPLRGVPTLHPLGGCTSC